MKRYPFALPVVITLSSSWLATDLTSGLEIVTTGLLAAGLMLSGWTCHLLKRHAIAVLCFGMGVGTFSALQLRMELGLGASGPAPDCRRGAAVPVRVDGIVEQVLGQSHGSCRYVLSGEADAACAPCVRMRCLVHQRADGPFEVGQRRIVSGFVRRPLDPMIEGEFSEVSYAHSLGCAVVVERARSQDVGPPPMHITLIEELRSHVRRRLVSSLDTHTAGVCLALAIGERSMLDPASRRAYRLSGTAHIFSVSGSHVAIITWLVMLLIGRRPGALMVLSGCLIIALYTVVAGAETPAVRSAIMGIAALVGTRSERDVDALHLLMASVLAISTIDPQACMSGAFFLSVTATLALILGVPGCRETLERCIVERRNWKASLASAVAVSWAATLGVTVPAALAFGSIAVMSPVANLVVVPMMSAALVLTLGLVLIPVDFVSVAFSWWLEILIRSADAVSRVFALDILPGASQAEVILLAIITTLVLLWPLVARTWSSLLVRLGTGCLAMLAITAVLRSDGWPRPKVRILERRHGSIVVMAADTVQIYLIGSAPAPVDHTAVEWVRAQHPSTVVGLGSWGRRMKGAIQHDTDSTER
jgi:ComEC/Rec2-related protein